MNFPSYEVASRTKRTFRTFGENRFDMISPATVRAAFHAACAGGFQRTTRVVEPHIATRNHLPRDMHVVVLNEYQVALQVAVFAKMNNVLDVAFAVVVTVVTGLDYVVRAITLRRQHSGR